MPSNREAYFEALKLDIPKSIIEFALKEVNGFSNLELTKNFDEEIKDYMVGNLCRCTGYQAIVQAVLLASEEGEGLW